MPLSLYADGDNDTLTEVCTKETFWCGRTEDDQEFCDTARGLRKPAFIAGTRKSRKTEAVAASVTPRHPIGTTAGPPSNCWSAAWNVAYCALPDDMVRARACHERDPALLALMTVRLLT